MFDLLGRCAKSSEDGLLILGAMLYRNGFCLDHSIVKDEVRLNIPKYSLSVLKSELSHLGEFPIESFIYFMDLLVQMKMQKYMLWVVRSLRDMAERTLYLRSLM